MNGTNQNQSLGKSELRYYFIRLTISKLYEMCMEWCEKVSNTDVSKTGQKCMVCNLLSNSDCLKSVSKFSQGYTYPYDLCVQVLNKVVHDFEGSAPYAPLTPWCFLGFEDLFKDYF